MFMQIGGVTFNFDIPVEGRVMLNERGKYSGVVFFLSVSCFCLLLCLPCQS